MKAVLLALVLALPCSAAERECGIEDKALLKYVQRVAKRNHGSKVIAASLSASWSNSSFRSVRVEVGGCEHFGLNVIGVTRQSGVLSEAQVFALTKRLANSTLPPVDAAALAKALNRREFSTGRNEDAIVYTISIPGLQEFGFSVALRSGATEIWLGGTGD